MTTDEPTPTEAQWAKVPRAIVRDDLSVGALRTFIVLSSYADRWRTARASQARLAGDLGVSRAQAQRWLDELAEGQWIRVRRQMRLSGGWGVNFYLCAPFPQVTTDAQEQARAAGIGVEMATVTIDDAQAQARFLGNAMPRTEHEPGARDAQSQARTWALSDLFSQTLSGSNPYCADPRFRDSDAMEETEEQERDEEGQGTTPDGWSQIAVALCEIGISSEDAFLRLAREWVKTPPGDETRWERIPLRVLKEARRELGYAA